MKGRDNRGISSKASFNDDLFLYLNHSHHSLYNDNEQF